LHPVAAATVPSLPRRQDLLVGALLVGSMSLLARTRMDEARDHWRSLAAALALFFLALGSKEIAYAGLAVVPCVAACVWWGTTRARSGSTHLLKTAAPILVAFLVLEGVAMGLRWWVLGGLGGYYDSPAVLAGTQGIVEFFVRPYVTDLLWPFQSVMPDRLRDWLLMCALLAIVAGGAVAGFRKPQQRLMAVVGAVWLAAFLLLYAVVHTSLSAYLLYVPLAGLALLTGALLDGATDVLKYRVGAHRLVTFPGVCAVVSLAGSGLLLIGVVRGSALFTDYTEFRDAGLVSKQFIDQAISCLALAPAGMLVGVDGLPHRIDYGSSESQFVDAYMFEPYSVESVVRLFAPGARGRVEVRSSQEVRVRPRSITVTCSPGRDEWEFSGSIVGDELDAIGRPQNAGEAEGLGASAQGLEAQDLGGDVAAGEGDV
jgi:hypothetical protein